MTQLCFVIFIIILWRLSYIADKNNNKYIIALCAFSLSIICGLRGEFVGIDTHNYLNAFVNDFSVAWNFKEIGFRFFSRAIMSLFNAPSLVFLLYALITNFLIIYRLWDFRKNCNFSFMFFLYETIFLFNTMNIMRQFLALALVFFATRYLDKKKYFFFLSILIVATSIHTSAIMALAFFVVSLWGNTPKNKKKYIIIPLLMLTVFGLWYVYNKTSNLIDNYYINGVEDNNINFAFIYRITIFVIANFFERLNVKIKCNNQSLYEPKKLQLKTLNEFNVSTFYYFAGLLVSSTGMFFKYLSRAGYYYLIFEIVFWGYLTKNSKNNKMNMTLIITYALYVFVHELIYNGNGIFPYYFSFL